MDGWMAKLVREMCGYFVRKMGVKTGRRIDGLIGRKMDGWKAKLVREMCGYVVRKMDG
jgi:hypothetical protein